MSPANGSPSDEALGIVDFALDPVDRIVWVILDHPPSEDWWHALELLVVDDVSGAAVIAEARRLSLPTDHHDEVDTLGALLALIAAANRAASALAPGSGR
jgi:hypothetical protein